jgi:hypothetical protein
VKKKPKTKRLNGSPWMMKSKRFQFDLRAVLCTMVIISLGMAYLRSLDEAFVAYGLIVAAVGLALGALVGWPWGRIPDAQYWSVLGGVFALISALQIVHSYWAWAATGAAAGAVVGTAASGRVVRTMISGCLAAAIVFSTATAIFPTSSGTEFYLDLISAPLIGAAFGLLVEIFYWLESKGPLPRYVSATVLMVAVCVGNFLAR